VKRMLAYSSVAHAGYIALAVLSMDPVASPRAILFYTLAYSIATISAFTVLFLIERQTGRVDFAGFEGLFKYNPFLSFVLTVSMLSLAGIPPTAGFFGKYYIFLTAVNNHYTSLVIIAILMALVGVYYYFRVIVAVYFKPEHTNIAVPVSKLHITVLVVTTLLTLLFGLFPDLVLQLL